MVVAGLQPASGAELSLDDCVSWALGRNSGLKSGEMSVAAAAQGAAASRAAFYPSLRLKGEYGLIAPHDRLIINGNSFAPGVPPHDVNIPIGDNNRYDASLIVQQPLFTGGNLTRSLERARSEERGAQYALDRQRKLITLEVKRLFNEVLNDQLQERVVRTLLEAKRERLRVLRERQTEGYAEREEVLTQEADLLSAEAELTRCANRTALAVSRLRLLIHFPSTSEFILKGRSHRFNLNLSLADAVRESAANREDLKGAREKVIQSEAEVGVTRSSLYPQSSLVGSYTVQKETNIQRPQYWMVMAQLDWQLFDWGKTRKTVERAEAIRREQSYQREELEKQVALETESSWRNVQNRQMTIDAARKWVAVAESRLEQRVSRYQEGTAKFADLLDGEAELIRSYGDYVAALNDLGTDLAQLEASASMTVDPWLVEEEVYQLDLDALSRRLTRLSRTVAPEKKPEPPALIPEKKKPEAPALAPEKKKPEPTSGRPRPVDGAARSPLPLMDPVAGSPFRPPVTAAPEKGGRPRVASLLAFSAPAVPMPGAPPRGTAVAAPVVSEGGSEELLERLVESSEK
ncbi:TolC family protein [Geomesophilobacter sediminis]|uniref:TolC family protein n=1 Tax=Geomesophilobacter sediminis TaxID=2798584 RepID=A0A8J7JGN5_9BACT|nr:TolC family protein [Geomesophilobacter sediminis]MBJ6723660.1 TolC family protein [Geomesophilobacter sediminis]